MIKIPYMGINNRSYADPLSSAVLTYVFMNERFISGHDDSAGFMEMIDTDNNVMKSWKYDFPMVNRFSDPNAYDDDCLAFYLMKTYGVSVRTGYYHLPDWIKEELY